MYVNTAYSHTHFAQYSTPYIASTLAHVSSISGRGRQGLLARSPRWQLAVPAALLPTCYPSAAMPTPVRKHPSAGHSGSLYLTACVSLNCLSRFHCLCAHCLCVSLPLYISLPARVSLYVQPTLIGSPLMFCRVPFHQQGFLLQPVARSLTALQHTKGTALHKCIATAEQKTTVTTADLQSMHSWRRSNTIPTDL